jgi:hypothetical protein
VLRISKQLTRKFQHPKKTRRSMLANLRATRENSSTRFNAFPVSHGKKSTIYSSVAARISLSTTHILQLIHDHLSFCRLERVDSPAQATGAPTTGHRQKRLRPKAAERDIVQFWRVEQAVRSFTCDHQDNWNWPPQAARPQIRSRLQRRTGQECGRFARFM